MPILQIPEPYVGGLIKIGDLEEESLKELLQALGELTISAPQDELIADLTGKVKSIEKNALEEIISALIGLFQAQIQLEITRPELVSLICSTMVRSSNAELKRIAQKCESFGDRLAELLKAGPLEPLAKASINMADHDCIFLESRVLTDIRAVFGEDPDASPLGATITHMLTVAYLRNRRRESFYLALNSKDLDKLAETIKRAKSKEKSLEKLLGKAGTPLLDSE